MKQPVSIPDDHLLNPFVVARCFWFPRCLHEVRDRPQAAHDAMETHYSTTHRDDIRKIIGWYA